MVKSQFETCNNTTQPFEEADIKGRTLRLKAILLLQKDFSLTFLREMNLINKKLQIYPKILVYFSCRPF